MSCTKILKKDNMIKKHILIYSSYYIPYTNLHQNIWNTYYQNTFMDSSSILVINQYL